MSAIHIEGRDGILCSTVTYSTRSLVATARLSDVTCQRCSRRLALMDLAESDAAAERRHSARIEAACRTVGVGHLWDALDAEEDGAYRDMVRGLLGAVAHYFAECGVVDGRQEIAA